MRTGRGGSGDREIRLTDGSESWIIYVGSWQNKRGLIVARDRAGVRQPVKIWTLDDAFASSSPVNVR